MGKKKINSKNLYERRIALNLTQEELGKKIGVTKQSIQHWEEGSNSTTENGCMRPILSKNLCALANVMGCSIAYLEGISSLPNGTGDFYDNSDPESPKEISFLGLPKNQKASKLNEQLSSLSDTQLAALFNLLPYFRQLNDSHFQFLESICHSLTYVQIYPNPLYPSKYDFTSYFENCIDQIAELNKSLHASPLSNSNTIRFDYACNDFVKKGLHTDYQDLFKLLIQVSPEIAFKNTYKCLENIEEHIGKLHCKRENMKTPKTSEEKKLLVKQEEKLVKQEQDLIILYQRICNDIKNELTQTANFLLGNVLTKG